MRCPRCNGAIIHDQGDSLNGPRDYCFSCGREPEKGGEVPDNKGEDTMAYHLNPEKEEKVGALLKDHSIREIVTKTGVAFNTIARIRNENLTEGERAELKKRATVKGRNKRELEKRESRADLQNGGQNIPPTNSDEKGGQEIMAEETKVCTKCGVPKLITEFNKNAARPSGRESQCKTCTTQRQRDYKAAREKTSGGNGRRKKQLRDPGPVRTPRADLDQQLAIDLKTIKKRVAAEVLQIYHEGGQRAVEEAFT